MPDGTQVFCWRMENAHGLYAELLDYGAALRALFVPDRDGILRDVVQGYDTLDEYRSNGGSFGATIGRVANRIGGASFVLNGTNYPLAQNCGPNHIMADSSDSQSRSGREQKKPTACGSRASRRTARRGIPAR